MVRNPEIKYLNYLSYYKYGLFLTDSMELFDCVESAIEECENSFMIINNGIDRIFEIHEPNYDKKYNAKELKELVATSNIYCKKIKINKPKTKILTESFSIYINDHPITFIFDYPFMYGNRKDVKAIITRPCDLLRLHYSHRNFIPEFDEPFKGIKTRSEFLNSTIAIRDLIKIPRYLCGYVYTQQNLMTKPKFYDYSIGEMWIK